MVEIFISYGRFRGGGGTLRVASRITLRVDTGRPIGSVASCCSSPVREVQRTLRLWMLLAGHSDQQIAWEKTDER